MSTFKMMEGWGFVPLSSFLIAFKSDDVNRGSIDVEILVSEVENLYIGDINDTEDDYSEEEIETIRQLVQKMIDEDKLHIPEEIVFDPLTGKR